MIPVGAEDAQVVPFDVNTLPFVLGATTCTADVPLPRITLLAVKVAAPVPPFATGNVPVTPVVKGKPVALVNVADVGVPKRGVTSVGLVANTKAPVPVSSLTAAKRLADVIDPNDVALPTLVTAPVKLALVVTLPAVKPAAVPVMFVPTNALGVPRAGVTNVGDVAKANTVPVPVVVYEVPQAVPVELAMPAPG